MSIGEYEASLRERAVAARRRLFDAKPPVRMVAAMPQPVAPKPSVPDLTAMPAGAAILHGVARKYAMTPDEIKGPSRRKEVMPARYEVCFRLVVEAGYSYPQAGRFMGGRHHTTVLHSIRRFVASSPEAAEQWAEFQNVKAERAEAHRLRAIEMYFEHGYTLSAIRRALGVFMPLISQWIAVAENERMRKGDPS